MSLVLPLARGVGTLVLSQATVQAPFCASTPTADVPNVSQEQPATFTAELGRFQKADAANFGKEVCIASEQIEASHP